MGCNKKKDLNEKEVDQSNVNTAEVNVPETRMQGDQVYPKAAKAEETSTPKTGFTKTVTKPKGGVLKQEIAASVMTNDTDFAGPTSSGVSVSKAGLRSLSYSGDAGTILGSAANTPIVGKADRANTRLGRKFDETNKKINYLASEQVLVEYDAPKPLGEASDSPQGYPGTPKNTSARSQKNNGVVNADLMFDRSVDEITRDEVFFTSGQIVKEDGVEYSDAPTKRQYFNEDGELVEAVYDNPRGNFAPKYIEVEITKASSATFVSKFLPHVDDWSTNHETYDVVNHAGTNAIIDMNRSEIDRQNIDSKAGRETAPNWNPLGRATIQPTQILSYLRDLENELGAFTYTSKRFASKQFSYQLNKAAKDGQRVTAPMREMFYHGLVKTHTSSIYEDDGTFNAIFNKTLMREGSADTMIAIFDSKGKYTTKADILTQPRSLKMHFATAGNNIDQFHVKDEFIKALDAHDVFSTIDREYDPMSPVCILDGVRLVTTHDWSKQFAYTQELSGGKVVRTWTSTLYSYFYSNRSSNYLIKVTNPLLAGIAYFIEQHASKLYEELADNPNNNGTVTWKIPVRSTTKAFSLWDFLVLASVPFIQYERTNTLKDVLDFEVNFEYPFSQLSSLKNYSEISPSQYIFKGITEPLVTKQMKPMTAITWTMPELFWKPGKDTNSSNRPIVVHPFYFAETRYKFTSARTFKQESNAGSMLFPVVRAGVRLGYLDDVYGLTERPMRFAYDMMVRSPYDKNNATLSGGVYKYSQAAEGMIFVKLSDSDEKGFVSVADLMSTPRELGWSAPAPLGVVTNTPVGSAGSNIIGAFYDYDNSKVLDPICTPSYKIYTWNGKYKATQSLLGKNAVQVDRAQAFYQEWDEYASYSIIGNNASAPYTRPNKGLVFSVGMAFNSATPSLKPFTDGYATNNGAGGRNAETAIATAPALKQINNALWTLVQKLFFVINPFDTCQDELGYDVFDYAYLFNCAGFMCSDYEEDINNRITEVQNAGWLFVSDPFVKDSYLYK